VCRLGTEATVSPILSAPDDDDDDDDDDECSAGVGNLLSRKSQKLQFTKFQSF
jgi:hypothetical protein